MIQFLALVVFGLGPLAHDETPDLQGPGRFCGYAPIIDLLPDEKVIVLESGIHGGRFLWEGSFGSLEVFGVGWARRPSGRIVEAWTSTRPARFVERRVEGGYQVAVWNGANAAAYFTSPSRFTRQQLRAVRRVTLYEEGQSPEGCDLRTRFSWDRLGPA